jgi:hypothetical protein
MLAYIPAPWIRHGIWVHNIGLCKRWDSEFGGLSAYIFRKLWPINVFLNRNHEHPKVQCPIQVPKMEVLYHIRPHNFPLIPQDFKKPPPCWVPGQLAKLLTWWRSYWVLYVSLMVCQITNNYALLVLWCIMYTYNDKPYQTDSKHVLFGRGLVFVK